MPYVLISVQAMGRKPLGVPVCAILLLECNLVNLYFAVSLKGLTLEVETQQVLVSVTLLK